MSSQAVGGTGSPKLRNGSSSTWSYATTPLQSIALTELIFNIHQLSTLFYSTRNPKELGAFKWIIDAKEKNITEAESWWKKIVKPFLQDLSIREPLKVIQEGDYSYYKPFMYENGKGGNINKILSDLSFKDSRSEEGLQIVDILTNALQRALNNKLKFSGWHRLGKLMVHQRNQNIQGIILKERNGCTRRIPYYDVIQYLNNSAKNMF